MRAHDVGGESGHGPVTREDGEPPFHHEWEARVFALNRLLLSAGIYNLDEFRLAVERLPRLDDASVDPRGTYYGRWLTAVEHLLAARRLLP